MLKRAVVVATCLLAAWPTWTLSAQESATLVLRAGDRITGELMDLGGTGFIIRVNGQERRVRQADVAVIELTAAPPSPEARAKLGQQFVMLRNGQTVDGRLNDIGGSYPLRITLDTPSGQRDLSSNEIAQIYLDAPPQSASAVEKPLATVGDPGPGRTVLVPANQAWTATGLAVRGGQMLRLQATGEIQFSGDVSDRARAAGHPDKRVAGAPIPDAFAGALIGRIGNGRPFGIGNQTVIRAPETGQLHLGVNDDLVADNVGQFQVSIIPPPR